MCFDISDPAAPVFQVMASLRVCILTRYFMFAISLNNGFYKYMEDCAEVARENSRSVRFRPGFEPSSKYFS